MAFHKSFKKKVKETFRKLNERADREAAAKREKIDVANPFGRLRQISTPKQRTAQERGRSGR